MNRTGARRLGFLLLVVAAVAVVGAAAYNVGLGAHDGVARPIFGMGRGYGGGMGFGTGFSLFGLFGALLIGFLVVWLFVALLSGSAGAGRLPTDPVAGDRLRELAEMHDKGTLTDDEFTAAKRKMLGL